MKSERIKVPPPSPFRGIHPYRYIDQDYFYGREKVTESLLVNVLMSRVVLLFGESGSGKSSIINAGLMPKLKKEGYQPERLRVRPFAEAPILVERIESGDGDTGSFFPSLFDDAAADKVTAVQQTILCPLDGFVRIVREKGDVAKPVLIFDQFEEIFTLWREGSHDGGGTEADLQARILAAILDIVKEPRNRTKLVVIIREDFLGKLEILSKDYPQIFDHYIRLDQLDQPSATRAILGPFEKDNSFSSRIQPDLAAQVIRELAEDRAKATIHSTQLQIVCSRLWDEYASTNSEIALVHFRQQGGVKGILEGFLQSELKRMGPELEPWAVMILGYLITESNTRDIVSEAKLKNLISSDKEGNEALIKAARDKLEKQKIINRVAQRKTFYFEVASEYLIPPIQRQTQLLREQQVAEKERQRSRKKIQYLGIGIFVLGTIAVVLFAFLTWFREQSRIIQEERDYNTAYKLSLQSQKFANESSADPTSVKISPTSDDRLDLALLLGVEATKRSQRADIQSNLLATLNSHLHIQGFLHGHTAAVRSVDVALDNRTIVSAGDDKKILVWDTGCSCGFNRLVFPPITGHIDKINSVRFSPDGLIIASGSSDKTIGIWNASTGQNKYWLRGHKKAVNAVSFSPNGKILASADADGVVILWEVDTWARVASLVHLSLQGDPSEVATIAFSPSGNRLASGSKDGLALLWDLNDLKKKPQQFTGLGEIYSLIFPLEERLVAGCACGSTYLINLQNGEKNPFPRLHNQNVYDLASNKEKMQVVSSTDKYLVVYDLNENNIKTFGGYADSFYSLGFSSDGNRAVTGTADGTVILWSLSLNQYRNVEGGPQLKQEVTPTSLVFSPDGHTLLIGSMQDKLIRYSMMTTQEIAVEEAGQGGITAISFAMKDAILATGGADNSLVLRDPTTLSAMGPPLAGHSGPVLNLVVSPDGRYLASSACKESSDVTSAVQSGRLPERCKNEIFIWDLSDRHMVHRLLMEEEEKHVLPVAISLEDDLIATGDTKGRIHVWDLRKGEITATLTDSEEHAVTSVVFSPDNKALVSGNDQGSIAVLNRQKGERIGSTRFGHPREINKPNAIIKLVFDSEGHLLISAGKDNTIRFWRFPTGESIGVPVTTYGIPEKLHQVSWMVALSPKENKIASAGLLRGRDNDQPFVAMINTGSDKWQETACLIAARDLTDEEWNTYVGQGDDQAARITCPQAWLAQADLHALRNEPIKVEAIYEQLLPFIVESNNASWANSFCWEASLHGFARLALPVCDKAVEKASPGNKSPYQDSRGVARALTGDYEGAIDDFQVHVRWLREAPLEEVLRYGKDEAIRKRETWIKALKQGENPFTAETLRDLRIE